MTTLIQVTPQVALILGVAMLARAQHLYSKVTTQPVASGGWRTLFVLLTTLALPTFVHAAAADLRTATESGNAIIMYLSGTFAAVGIVSAGVLMMTGRQSIAKWAFAGAMVCGLAFAIVRTMWTNMGLEASDVGTFNP